MVGKRACSARITRDSTVPSPTPASNSRSAGGDGCSVDNSSEIRLAISVFSLQVDTNKRYFCRLSKKRKPGGAMSAAEVTRAAGEDAAAADPLPLDGAGRCSLR